MDVLIVLASPEEPHRVSLAKNLAEALSADGIIAEIQATRDDHAPFAPEAASASALVVALAGPGASFPAALARNIVQPVILLPTTLPGFVATTETVTMGSAAAPLARVAVNHVGEAAALVSRLLSVNRKGGHSDTPGSLTPSSAKNATVIRALQDEVEAAVCAATLQLSLGTIDAVEAAERRSQAYVPLIDLERRGMGNGLGSKPVPSQVIPWVSRYQGKVSG